MKITTFNPLILTKNEDDVISLFEALGFEIRHRNDNIKDRQGITAVRMKHENGFHVDIVQSNEFERDRMTIRINVDDFEEAYKLFEERGFKPYTEKPANTKSSKSISMIALSGFWISLCEHIKNHEQYNHHSVDN
jgi:hypothetical protein